MINNTEAIELIRQATTVKTGFEQVDLCQRAATLLTLPKTSVNGTNSGTPSTMQGVLHKASGSYEGDGHLTNGQSSMRTIDATPTGGASSSNSVHT